MARVYGFMPDQPPSEGALIENSHNAVRSGKCIAFQDSRCFDADLKGPDIPIGAIKIVDRTTKRVWYYNMMFAGLATGNHMLVSCARS